MSYPDNFNPAAFDRAQGCAAYDRAVAVAHARIRDHVAAAIQLREAARAFMLATEALVFSEPGPTRGYDLADIRAAVSDAAAIDADAYRARLLADILEVK